MSGWVYDVLTDKIVDTDDGGTIADLVETVAEEDGHIMAASRELYGAVVVAIEFMNLPLEKKAARRDSLLEQLNEALDRAHGDVG